MKRPLHLNWLFLAAVSAALLVACGDSDSSKGDSTGTAGGLEEVAELENGKKLRCDESYEGAVAAMANGGFRRCVDGAWVKISRSEAMKADEILGIVKDSDSDDEFDEKSSSSKGGDKPKPESSSSKASSTVIDSDRESSSSEDDFFIVENVADLPVCSAKREGYVAIVEDTDEKYVCKDYEWVLKTSSNSSSAKSSSSVNPDFDQESSSSSEDEDPKEDIYKCADGSIVENEEDCEKQSSSSTDVDQESSSSSIEYGTLVDERDGQTYKTVKIGTQVWMAENLNYDYNEGTAKSFCYNDSTKYCKIYGRLYLWSAAMDSAAVFSDNGKGCGYEVECSPSGRVRGVCPEGWHLPSNDEWEELFTAVGGREDAGRMLKSETGWYDGSNGTDEFGFSALPAGRRNDYGDFYDVGYHAIFWSSSEDGSYGAYLMYLFYDREEYAGLDYVNKYYAYSVRCFQDSNESTGNTDPDQESSSSETSSSSSSTVKDGSEYDPVTETLKDLRDGKTYKTVKIGTQVWMAENLNYDYNEGTAKSYVNKEYPEYGRYYTWAAAMDSAAVFSDDGKGCGYEVECSPSGRVRGVCPAGWHLPSQEEWEELFTEVGGKDIAGKMLKSETGWYDGGNGTDEFGFSALPAGGRFGSGNFHDVGDFAYFWSSSEDDSGYANYMDLNYDLECALLFNVSKSLAYSVRCFQD